MSPKKHVDKVYFAKIDGKVTEEDVRRFAEGLEIGEEKPTLPAHLEILKREEISEIRLTIREGKFHQVKRMFHAVGKGGYLSETPADGKALYLIRGLH